MTERTGQIEMGFGMDAAIDRASDWAAAARSYIERLPIGSRFSADTLRRYVGDPPAHGDAIGAVIACASREGRIRAAAITTSSRPERHRARLIEWEVS